MKSNHLFILVEGNDDKSFIKFILKKCFKKYTPRIIKYAEKTSPEINNYLLQIKKNNGYYAMLADKDSNSIESSKQFKSEKHGITPNHIVIVDQCIEGWYVSGSNIDYRRKSINDTRDITKKKFKDLSGGTKHASKENMQKILKSFDIEKAKQHSKSFKYFYNNLELIIKQS